MSVDGLRWKATKMIDVQKADRNAAVVAVVMARYLATNDPNFLAFCKKSLEAAAAAGIVSTDLTMLRTVIGAVAGDTDQLSRSPRTSQ